MDSLNDSGKEIILRHFELSEADGTNKVYTEEEFFELLSGHVLWMIEHRLDYLLSLMYRLDIDENKINRALHPGAPEPANEGLARLIIERQKQRIQTKQQYREESGATEWDWDW